MSWYALNINCNSHFKPSSIFSSQKWLLSPLKGLNLARAHKFIYCHQSDSATEARGYIFLIEVPPKVWRPKVQNKYTPQDYMIDINDGIFDFDFYGKKVFAQNMFVKRVSRTILSLSPKIYIKNISRRNCAYDLTLTQKPVLESQMS